MPAYREIPDPDPQLLAAARKNRHGDFELTDAIRTAPESTVIPQEGYRVERYRGIITARNIPVVVASVTKQKLFEAFLEIVDPLGELVDVVLETSHDSPDNDHADLYREAIDLPVLKSHVQDFEDLLLNDGCTGIAVLSKEAVMEVQFDEHKLLVVYAEDPRPFIGILERCGVTRNNAMRLISEGEHLHSTTNEYPARFEELRSLLGAEAQGEEQSWQD